nr:unnamed protein product [Callosobruchus analis]
MTPQLLVPNPKNTRFNIASQELKSISGDDTPAPSPESKKYAILYCKSRVKIRFRVYSGWCTDGAFRVVREHHKQQ